MPCAASWVAIDLNILPPPCFWISTLEIGTIISHPVTVGIDLNLILPDVRVSLITHPLGFPIYRGVVLRRSMRTFRNPSIARWRWP
jgi:hypothetical protein